MQLSGFMIEMLQETFEEKINIITPIEEESRGCQGNHFRSDFRVNFQIFVDSFDLFRSLSRKAPDLLIPKI